MKLLTHYYNTPFPNIDDIVLGKVIKMTDFGIDIELLEYCNKTAYLSFKDASNRRRLKGIKKQIQINKEYPFTVISVIEEKDFIDLSKKYQSKEEEAEFIEFYKKYKFCLAIVYNFIRFTESKTVEEQEKYMDKTVWKFPKKEVYNSFRDIKRNKELLNKLDLTEVEKDKFYEILETQFKDVKYNVRFNIKINSLHIDAKNKILEFLKMLETEFGVTPYIHAVPIYTLEFNNVFENDLENFLDTTKQKINSFKKENLMININDIEQYEK